MTTKRDRTPLFDLSRIHGLDVGAKVYRIENNYFHLCPLLTLLVQRDP